MRTFNREDWLASQEEWKDYGSEWRWVQALAASRGMIYPPSGSKWDSWEDEEPSQRAIIYRAIEDTPEALRTIIGQSRSRNEVVRKLMADLDRRREDADLVERQIEWDRQYEPAPHEATLALKAILDRIGDS